MSEADLLNVIQEGDTSELQDEPNLEMIYNSITKWCSSAAFGLHAASILLTAAATLLHLQARNLFKAA